MTYIPVKYLYNLLLCTGIIFVTETKWWYCVTLFVLSRVVLKNCFSYVVVGNPSLSGRNIAHGGWGGATTAVSPKYGAACSAVTSPHFRCETFATLSPVITSFSFIHIAKSWLWSKIGEVKFFTVLLFLVLLQRTVASKIASTAYVFFFTMCLRESQIISVRRSCTRNKIWLWKNLSKPIWLRWNYICII